MNLSDLPTRGPLYRASGASEVAVVILMQPRGGEGRGVRGGHGENVTHALDTWLKLILSRSGVFDFSVDAQKGAFTSREQRIRRMQRPYSSL